MPNSSRILSQASCLHASLSALLAAALSVPLDTSPTLCCALLVISMVGTPRYDSASLIQWSYTSKTAGSRRLPRSRTVGEASWAYGDTKTAGTRSAIAR